LAVTLLLLVAGMEVDLSSVRRQGATAIAMTAGGLLVPLAVGSAAAWFAPAWWGMPAGGSPALFAALFGAALAVSALPVIAKVLLDLDLFQSDFGVLVLVVATLTNIIAWLVFSVVLGGGAGGVAVIVVATVGFAVAMLTVGRWVADRCLVWVQAHFAWPSGILGFAIVVGLLGGAATESFGVHAIFGAFLAGIALGDSPHLREQARHIVHRFVEGILAPIFVAAIGLEVNFAASFDLGLVLSVLALGTAVKVVGTWLGPRLIGRGGVEVWGASWALNARGELGIVLGLLAWRNGLISESLFVALVALAVITSALAGPMLKRLLRRERAWTLAMLLDKRACLTGLEAENAGEAIHVLSQVAAERAQLPAEDVTRAVLAREEMMGTGLGHGIAVPHARLPALADPVVVVGVTRLGVDFEGVDEEPVRLIFLILTAESDPAAQLQILAAIGKLSHNPAMLHDVMAAQTSAELLGALRVADVLHQDQVAAA
jgi:Kef-type K+ transport system membrane component KefB/mannitol/fructose-specific phosphotransferase system IIA component (Ntr-type)